MLNIYVQHHFQFLLGNLFFQILSVSGNTKLKLPQTKRDVLGRLSVAKMATSRAGRISSQLPGLAAAGKSVPVLEFTLN